MDATSTAASNAAFNAPTFDEPYRFGRKPTTACPFPFTERQFARLLIVRSRLHETPAAADQADA